MLMLYLKADRIKVRLSHSFNELFVMKLTLTNLR